FQKYYEKMTPRIDIEAPLLVKGNLKKIYVFGPTHAGKTEFVRNLEINQFRQYKDNEMKRDLASKIYDFVIDNIEVLTFECIDEHTNKEKIKLYEDCIDDAQGFILIFNAANKELLKETIEMFQLVLNRCLDQGETMPILIIGNKFENKEEITSDMIFENFDLNKLNECGLHPKYFSINILNEDDKIINALRWFITQII
ncbi:MAG: GTPase domain-containing protein, partial [Promethearchaeota archaeon]